MIPKEELNIDSYVIYVNYGKNFLSKIVSEGKPIQGRTELSRFSIEYHDSKSIAASTYNDMFRGIELTNGVKNCLSGFSPYGFYFDHKGLLMFKDEPYPRQPNYLHQFQKIYLDTYGVELPVDENYLENSITSVEYEEILDTNRNVIKINIKEGSKGAEAFQKMKVEKDAFREAVQSGKINEYAKKHPNVVDVNTLHHSQ